MLLRLPLFFALFDPARAALDCQCTRWTWDSCRGCSTDAVIAAMRATPDDVVRLYESAMTSLGDMTQLDAVLAAKGVASG